MPSAACVTGASPRLYGWLSPRVSLARDDDRRKDGEEKGSECGDFLDFEFRLCAPSTMLTAEELFADGKVAPRKLSEPRAPSRSVAAATVASTEAPVPDPCAAAMSPRAPTCSSQWGELLGLRRLRTSAKQELDRAVATDAGPKLTKSSSAVRSLKHLLHRASSSRSAAGDPSLSFPLLRDLETEYISTPTSSRFSHSSSSSSSGPDHEDLPRLSLDIEKAMHARARKHPRAMAAGAKSTLSEMQPTARLGRSATRHAPGVPATPMMRSASVDSPRMNASGKVIFQGLGRSSSSPSSLNGGGHNVHRSKYRGMEFTPVLNVPVFGLAQRSKKDKDGATTCAGRSSSARSRVERERP